MKQISRPFIFILICGFLLCASACKKKQAPIKQVKIEFKKEGELSFYKGSSDTLIQTFDIEIATTDYEIQTGLMYRDAMKKNRGMLFVFPQIRERHFYMKNTRFPLDLIFLDHNKNIVSFQENAQPLNESTLPSNALAQFVLEVNAGLAEELLLEVGDRMEYFEIQLVE